MDYRLVVAIIAVIIAVAILWAYPHVFPMTH